MNVKRITKQTRKFTDQFYQVYTKGTEEQPIWVFQVHSGEQILKGFLPEVKIGNLEVQNKPCSVKAIFEIQDEDIELTESTGLLPNMGRNTVAVMQRAYILRIIKSEENAYMSRAELLYE